MNVAANAIVQWVLANLTPLTAWRNRHQIPGLDQPGVYLIAEGPAHPLGVETVCIGSTTCLSYRLDQFHSSAFQGQATNGPGERHRLNNRATADRLALSVLPLPLPEPWKTALPPFLEIFSSGLTKNAMAICHLITRVSIT